MKALASLLLLTVILSACGGEPAPKPKTESLVEVKNGIYYEYYPGRKAIKYKGSQDSEGRRDGIWYFYDENGREQSMTEYVRGVRNGASFVRFPSGNMRYYGNYTNDQPSGVWIIYNEDGSVQSEKDYGKPQ